jgi:hypothetical protein
MTQNVTQKLITSHLVSGHMKQREEIDKRTLRRLFIHLLLGVKLRDALVRSTIWIRPIWA